MAGSIASSPENTDNSVDTQTHSVSSATVAISVSHSSASAGTDSSHKPTTRIRKEIVVIVDAKVEQYQTLVATIVGTNDIQANDVPIIALNSDRDSIEQITQILQSYIGIVTLYLIAQSQEQNLYPGSICLNRFNLDAYGWQLQQWAESLSDRAKILLYGCEIADSNQHKTFVQRLSLLTGATVLAQ